MKEQESNLSPRDPKLRTIAEAAYLINSEELHIYSDKRNTFEENYKNIIASSNYFNSLKKHSYEVLAIVDNKKDGFYAVALQSNDNEILIAIRGTDFSNFNVLPMLFASLLGPSQFAAELITTIKSSDLFSDLQIVLGKIPYQYKSAAAFASKIIKTPAVNNIIITGHSLGGLLAQLLAARFGIEAVVFDSPGAKGFIAKMIGNNFDLQKIKIVNALPNFINTCGEQIKVPLVVNNGGRLLLGCNFLGTIPHEHGEPAKYLLSHGMEDILNSISEDGIFKQVPIKNWPDNSLSFYASQEAYLAMPDIYDEYIYWLWKNQYENNFLARYVFGENPVWHLSKDFLVSNNCDFRTKYPTFASYKSDFLRYGFSSLIISAGIARI